MPFDGITRGKNCSRRNRELILCSAVYKTIVAFLWKPSYTDNFCPLHHVVGVVQVPFFPALRYFALGWSRTLIRTPLELHACCLLFFFASFVVVGVCMVFVRSPVLLLFLWAVPDVSLLRWLRIAEDRRPQPHTHTHCHRDFLPLRISVGGWFVPEFVCSFVCFGCPVALSSGTSVLFC